MKIGNPINPFVTYCTALLHVTFVKREKKLSILSLIFLAFSSNIYMHANDHFGLIKLANDIFGVESLR